MIELRRCTVLRLVLLVWAGLLVALFLVVQSPNLIPVEDINTATSYQRRVAAEDLEKFRAATAPVVVGAADEETKVLRILAWVMNQVGTVENFAAPSSWQMVEATRAGRGLTCGGLATIFRDALLANGIPARRVTLWRNFGDLFDTHVTVEAYVGGHWRVYDPTFHVALRSAGERVGAFEAREWFIKGRGQPVVFEFLGSVRYPVRLETYPTNVPVLFNNVFVETRRVSPHFGNLPKIGRWLGREYIYPVDDPTLSSMPHELYRTVRRAAIAALLALVLGWSLVAMAAIWRLCRPGQTLARRASRADAA